MNIIFQFSLLFLFLQLFLSQTCLNINGQTVSWWTILKIPPITGNKGYAYFDSTMLTNNFTFYNKSIDLEVSPLTLTLTMINKNDLDRVAWNDERPDNKTSSSKAHAKGIIAYSLSLGKGILFVHSIPKYPAFLSDHSIYLTIGSQQQKFGQHLTCFSLSLYQLNNVAGHLLMSRPYIYQTKVAKNALASNIYSLGYNQFPVFKELFQYYTLKPSGYTIQAIFKNDEVNGSIFEDGLVKWLKPGKIIAETWGRPLQSAWCSGQFEVLNVKHIKILDKIEWDEGEDHSKWMILGDKYSCFGDMNRMVSQWKRGGAFYCLDNPYLYKTMKGIITTTDKCLGQKNNLIKQQ